MSSSRLLPPMRPPSCGPISGVLYGEVRAALGGRDQAEGESDEWWGHEQ
jgi:hypothetical protein